MNSYGIKKYTRDHRIAFKIKKHLSKAKLPLKFFKKVHKIKYVKEFNEFSAEHHQL